MVRIKNVYTTRAIDAANFEMVTIYDGIIRLATILKFKVKELD